MFGTLLLPILSLSKHLFLGSIAVVYSGLYCLLSLGKNVIGRQAQHFKLYEKD
jgi:hypothetical protein